MWVVVGPVAILAVLVLYGVVADVRLWRARRGLSAEERAEDRARLPDEVLRRRRYALRWYRRSRAGRLMTMASIVAFIQGTGGGPN